MAALQVERFRPATLQETIALRCEGRRHRTHGRRFDDLPPIGGGAGISFDKALGSTSTSVTAAVTITTSQIAAAASRIVVTISWFDSGSIAVTVADSAGSYTKDKQFDNGTEHFAVFSRVLVGSLASGSSITATWTGTSTLGGQLLAACSYLGTTGVDTTATNSTTGTGFSSGAAANSVADAAFVGGAGNEASATTVGGTNTNGTSRFDIYNAGVGQGMRMLDLIVSSIGSQALTGTWASTSTATTGAVVVYKGVASPAIPMTNVRARMRARR